VKKGGKEGKTKHRQTGLTAGCRSHLSRSWYSVVWAGREDPRSRPVAGNGPSGPQGGGCEREPAVASTRRGRGRRGRLRDNGDAGPSAVVLAAAALQLAWWIAESGDCCCCQWGSSQ